LKAVTAYFDTLDEMISDQRIDDVKSGRNYRVVYLKENNILLITVIRIAHRKEVY